MKRLWQKRGLPLIHAPCCADRAGPPSTVPCRRRRAARTHPVPSYGGQPAGPRRHEDLVSPLLCPLQIVRLQGGSIVNLAFESGRTCRHPPRQGRGPKDECRLQRREGTSCRIFEVDESPSPDCLRISTSTFSKAASVLVGSERRHTAAGRAAAIVRTTKLNFVFNFSGLACS
jgi:hypothetical protein